MKCCKKIKRRHDFAGVLFFAQNFIFTLKNIDLIIVFLKQKLGRVGKLRQRALTAILPPELRQKKLDVA